MGLVFLVDVVLVKRSPLKTYKPLRAKTPLKAKKPMKRTPFKKKARRRQSTAEESAHILAVKALICCVADEHCSPGECRDAHHITGVEYRGLSQKAADALTIPLCKNHHQDGGLGVAIHAGIQTWEAKYGSQEYHVERTQLKLRLAKGGGGGFSL